MVCRRLSLWALLLLLAMGAAQTPSPPPATEVAEVEEAAAAAADVSAVEAADTQEVPGAEAEAAPEAESEEEAVETEEEEAPVAEAETVAPPPPPLPPPLPPSNKASMQWVVTAKMRAQLSKLGYSGAEVSTLDPERAAAIIRHSISRPAGGVPASWNRGAGGRRVSSSPMRAAVRMVGKPLASVPPAVLAPAVVLLLGGIGGLSGMGAAMGKKTRGKAVAAALAEPTVAPPVGVAAEEELWLDRQIDKLISIIKVLLGR